MLSFLTADFSSPFTLTSIYHTTYFIYLISYYSRVRILSFFLCYIFSTKDGAWHIVGRCSVIICDPKVWGLTLGDEVVEAATVHKNAPSLLPGLAASMTPPPLLLDVDMELRPRSGT